MVLMLPRVKSTSERFFDAIGAGAEAGAQSLMSQKHQAEQKQLYEELGIDPAISKLPKEAQAAYFKQQFASERQMTPLQESQQKLAEERLKALQSQQDLFNQFTGKNASTAKEEKNDSIQLNPQQRSALSQMPEENLIQLAPFAGQPGEMGILGNFAKGELERRKEEKKIDRQTFESEREFAYKRAGKILEEADKARNTLPIREAAVNAMEDAIENNDLSFFSLDNLAERTGIEAFRSASGGQFKAGSKNFLVSNVSKFGSRPNMYIEQQVADMLPKIGRSREANLTALEMLRFEKDIDDKRVKIIDDLEDHYMATIGFVPSNIGKEADKKMKSYVDHRQTELADRLKQLQLQEKNSVKDLTPDIALEYLQKAKGDRKKAEALAKKDGYKF